MILTQDLASSEPLAAKTVFVLDTDLAFRRFLAGLLLRAGFRAVLFGSGRDLLRALRALRPSMIVANLVVPETSSADLLGAIRDDSRDIPLVIMTDENDTALPLRVDAPVLYKPDVDGLVAIILSLLRARGLDGAPI
jgi:DNA-binding response OmpR family regulator